MKSKNLEEWGQISIGDLGTFYTGLTGKTAKDFGTGNPFLTYMQVYLQRTSKKREVNYVFIGDDEKQNKVAYGDIIFTTSSETPDEIGMTDVFLETDWTPYLNSFCFGLRVKDSSLIEPSFIKYLLRGDKFRKDIRPLAQGSTRFNLSKSNLAKLNILIPPLLEQKKIASTLSSVDKVIENTQRQINKLKDLKKAMMNKLLTKGIDHTEFKDSKLGKIPKNWVVKKLQDVGQCVRGLTFAPENVVKKGLLVLRSSNIKDGSLSFKNNVFVNIKVDNQFLSQEGDILICVRNGSRHLLGKSALIIGDRPQSTHGAFMTIFRTDNYKFVRFLIQSDWFFTQVSRDIGATINSINNKNLLEYSFAFPPLNEQLEISNILDSVEKQIDNKKNKLFQTQSLKKSLMQVLLTGKIRMKVS